MFLMFSIICVAHCGVEDPVAILGLGTILVVIFDAMPGVSFHYENTLMQCTEIFKVVKNEIFSIEYV